MLHSTRSRRPVVLAAAGLLTLVAAAPATAGPGGAERESAARARIVTLAAGTSTGRAKKEAERGLPLAALAPAARGRAAAVLDRHSLFRTLPTLRFPIHADACDYFVQNPDVCVALWRQLGVSSCNMWQTGPDSYEADAGDGSIGAFEVLLRGREHQLVLIEGQFKSPVLTDPIETTCLFHLHVQTAFDTHGRPVAVGKADLFVSFPSRTVGTAAKLISPVTNVILDRNFEECCLFAHLMDRSMATRPMWVEGLAADMDGVLPRRRGELTALTGAVYRSERRRTQAYRALADRAADQSRAR